MSASEAKKALEFAKSIIDQASSRDTPPLFFGDLAAKLRLAISTAIDEINEDVENEPI